MRSNYVCVVVLQEEHFLVKQIHPRRKSLVNFDIDLGFTSLFHVAGTFRIDGTSVFTSVEVFFNPVASSNEDD